MFYRHSTTDNSVSWTKILIINTLVCSLFVYLMQVERDPPDCILKEFDSIVHAFLWRDKKAKIKMSQIQAPRKFSRLKLTNLKLKNASIKIAWIFQNSPFAKVQLEAIPPPLHIGTYFWDCVLDVTDLNIYLENRDDLNPFWKDVIRQWFQFTWDPLYKGHVHTIIWYNSFIKIDGKIVNFIKAINKGLIFLRDLINKCGKFTKYETICNRFPGPLTWLEYLQLTAAIPKAWLNLDSQPSAKNFDNLCSKPHVVSYVYNELIANWNRDAENAFHRFNKEIDIQWEEYVQGFSNLYLVTNITKYRDFQYRLLLNVIHANNKLFYWKITDSKKCDYCEEAIQTPAHMLYLCPKICTIWHGLEKYVKEYFDLPPNVIENLPYIMSS